MFGKKRKRRKRKPMKRMVYLMERNPSIIRTVLAEFSFLGVRREIKIGVAKNSDDRHETVDRGIPGNVVFIADYFVSAATTVETGIHNRYKKERFTVRGAKRGAGATEFFKLTNDQIRDIQNTLLVKADNEGDPLRAIFTIIFAIIIYYLIFINEK